MSRQEFMERLNRLLSDIPVNERQEALNIMKTISRMQDRRMRQKLSRNWNPRKRWLPA